jgi:hypothetical protein
VCKICDCVVQDTGCKDCVSRFRHAASMHLGKLEIALIIVMILAVLAWLYFAFAG